MRIFKDWVLVASLQLLALSFLFITRTSKAIVPKNADRTNRRRVIVLTGTFYSDNWISSHLKPLAGAQNVRAVYMVASRRLPDIPNVVPVYAPEWLIKKIGEVPARLLVFIWICLKVRPDIVGGFHLLLNGMVASLIAAMMGIEAIYFCGGGVREVSGGGYQTESKLFGKLSKPNDAIERILLAIMSTIDITIAMGSSAIRYFQAHGVRSKFYIVPGGFDGDRFYPGNRKRDIDLVLVGRLSEVKCVDIFLDAVRLLKQDAPEISAIVVGGGPLKDDLENTCVELGISDNVHFVGMQDNVENFLRKAKIFVLTSSSEGLSLAMIEAMLCGLVPVVSDVGDLGDLVVDAQNGCLVEKRTAENFANIIGSILQDKDLLQTLSRNAKKESEKLLITNTQRRWDEILSGNAN